MWQPSKLDQVKKDAQRLADSVMSLAGEEGAAVGEKTKELSQSAVKKWEEADEWAHKNVWTTVAVSAVAAAALAMLFSSRGKK
ncbi:MAG: hypothetical protein HYR90_00745 [Candidatus Andersenbacteria bacterium]|nr:hypothetical protein [Candidatus Andersenbacteria bacterium]MBI3251224.1 hypothetical protein [Candidatus Andersenbacteria bacterium]